MTRLQKLFIVNLLALFISRWPLQVDTVEGPEFSEGKYLIVMKAQ